MMIRSTLLRLLALAAVAWLPLQLAHAQPAAETSEATETRKPADQTTTAAFVILGDPATVDFDPQSLQALLSLGRSGRYQMGGPSPPIMLGVVGSPRTGRAVVMATIRYSEPAEVEASIKAVEDHIRQVLTILYETRRKSQDESLERTTKQADRARATVDMLTQEMQQLRNRAITLGVIPGSLDAQLAGLQKSQLDIRVELAGLSARREAIVNRVAEMQKQQAEKQAGSQQVLDELTKVVELHMEQFARIRELQKTGTAPTSEVGRVQIELAKARADLESRRHQFAQEAETEALSLLNQQLADTQIEDQGKRAELMVIEETLAKLQSDEVRNTVDVYDRAVRQLESAVDEERMAAKQLSELKMQHDAMHEPSVLFIPQGLPEEKPQEK